MTWVSLFNSAELGDYRLPACHGTGGPYFVSPEATESVSEPLKVESNSRIPMPLEYWLTSGFFDSKQGQPAIDKCQEWLKKNRADLEKQGDHSTIALDKLWQEIDEVLSGGVVAEATLLGDPSSFCPQQALKSKSEPLLDKSNSKPHKPCFTCGSNDWWWRKPSRWGIGEALCSICHPNPNHNTPGVGETDGIINAPGGRR